MSSGRTRKWVRNKPMSGHELAYDITPTTTTESGPSRVPSPRDDPPCIHWCVH